MKSIFQEASSLGSAIEKAWQSVGSPENFEVKVLKKGESGFLGFCKIPFAVSITIPEKEKVADFKSRNLPNKKTSDSEDVSKSPRNNERRFESKGNRDRNNDRNRQTREIRQTEPSEVREKEVVEADNWTTENAKLAEGFLGSILEKLEIKEFSLKAQVEKNFLNIAIFTQNAGNILDKSFFICIAPLIVQMVKKSCGENPKGLRIVISLENDAK